MTRIRIIALLLASAGLGQGVGAFAAAGALDTGDSAADQPCPYELIVLGAGQDAGAPQIGNSDDDGPRLLPSSLALIDRTEGKRYLFDASPAITEQLAMLDTILPPEDGAGLGIDGVFLTHAHIGHYLGLAYLGREAAGAAGVPVYAMPRMAGFLRGNGPWSQLVELGNIDLRPVESGTELAGGLLVSPIKVPHRDEYSETVGFMITQPSGVSAVYLPDIDYWPDDGFVQELIHYPDMWFLDASFWDDNELPGRDMSEIPHPRVTETMDLLQHMPDEARAMVNFIHYNHTNPIRYPDSPEAREVAARGFSIARRGDRFCL